MKYKCWNHFCTFWQVLQWSICVVLWDLSTQRTLPRDVFAWYTAQAGILRHTMACVMSHKRKISTRAVTLRAPISHHSAVEALTSAHFVWVVVYAYVSQPSLFWALVDPWRTASVHNTFRDLTRTANSWTWSRRSLFNFLKFSCIVLYIFSTGMGRWCYRQSLYNLALLLPLPPDP